MRFAMLFRNDDHCEQVIGHLRLHNCILADPQYQLSIDIRELAGVTMSRARLVARRHRTSHPART